MNPLWPCAIGFHRWKRAAHLPRSLHNYRVCDRCLKRSVVSHPLEVRSVDWDWVEGSGPYRTDFPSAINQEPTMKPNLTIVQAEAVIETKTAPRVTKPAIEAKIRAVDYITQHAPLTICVITMRNGFTVTGTSASASAANYDLEVGKTLAYDRAFQQLWALEGYLLKEKLAAEDAL